MFHFHSSTDPFSFFSKCPLFLGSRTSFPRQVYPFPLQEHASSLSSAPLFSALLCNSFSLSCCHVHNLRATLKRVFLWSCSVYVLVFQRSHDSITASNVARCWRNVSAPGVVNAQVYLFRLRRNSSLNSFSWRHISMHIFQRASRLTLDSRRYFSGMFEDETQRMRSVQVQF